MARGGGAQPARDCWGEATDRHLGNGARGYEPVRGAAPRPRRRSRSADFGAPRCGCPAPDNTRGGPSLVASGFLLTTPFAIIIASSLAVPWTSGDRGKSAARAIAWATAVLSLWAIGDSIGAICVHQITAENRARFRRDLDKYWRRLRLPRLPRRFATGTEGAHGLRYSTFVDARGVAMNYALYVPRGYSGNRQYPLVLFLHGYGDRGTEGLQFTAVGLPFKLEYRDIDFLVLCPQGASGTWETGGEEARLAMELLASVQKTYRVDPKQVFLTGVSSGGTGVWDLAAEYRSCWAAIVPVASAPGILASLALSRTSRAGVSTTTTMGTSLQPTCGR